MHFHERNQGSTRTHARTARCWSARRPRRRACPRSRSTPSRSSTPSKMHASSVTMYLRPFGPLRARVWRLGPRSPLRFCFCFPPPPRPAQAAGPDTIREIKNAPPSEYSSRLQIDVYRSKKVTDGPAEICTVSYRLHVTPVRARRGGGQRQRKGEKARKRERVTHSGSSSSSGSGYGNGR